MGKKGQKMSMTEFLGGAPPKDNNLPTGPKQRSDGDDGAFNRNRARGMEDRESMRSEEDSQWRRGPGGGGG
eukprot:CAMPEP_0172297302 /NCGR_PEP_ID=MMETSP1058-20130122/381_1 /TAXON_ID=83371 /ORGANISM="Detonula confervacea, Strain CCMP 353" /LENGTH=70 /DNA_ID=CAMNT_0013006441 /DNA_START=155 /DNA_END=363 /DNA_ORIENTATION=+